MTLDAELVGRIVESKLETFREEIRRTQVGPRNAAIVVLVNAARDRIVQCSMMGPCKEIKNTCSGSPCPALCMCCFALDEECKKMLQRFGLTNLTRTVAERKA